MWFLTGDKSVPGNSLIYGLFVVLVVSPVFGFRKYSKDDVVRLREEVRDMFQHAYEGYLTYAGNYDELRPLSCDGVDTWGSYSLTLIDALDTLAVMGNFSEFRRVVGILTKKTDFNSDINVSVFETNIRIVGGLLGAHLMSLRAGVDLEPGWPCNGPLLRLAEDVAKRLLPAFDTKTGMPYGTVNLKYGVPAGETPVTCTAGVGTFIVEFGALSRLTGDPIYEEVALNALYALWKHRSPIGLFGNHIDVQTGRWTAQDAGIGAGVDSYYEYLVKGALMLNRPELLEMFHIGREAIDKYLKRDDWHVWVSMNKGQVTLPVFQSLEAYWPGVLSLIGDIAPAKKILQNYHSVWKQYGFLPEFYNIPSAEAGANRENYPLRPELIESAMYLYRATSDPYFLEVGEDMLRSIQYSAKTSCGYATIKNVRDHRKEDRMESFFLAETTKYLYLLFDPDNFLHNDGGHGTVHETPNGVCIIQAGGYIFNTEAHPIDPSALRCCHDNQDWFEDFRVEKFLGDELLRRDDIDYESDQRSKAAFENYTIEIETTVQADLTRQQIIEEIMSRFKSSDNESDQIVEKAEEIVTEKLSDAEPSEQDQLLTEALRAEKLLRKVIDEMENNQIFNQLDEMKIMDSKITGLIIRLERAIESFLKDIKISDKAILDDKLLSTNETTPDHILASGILKNYENYAQDRLTLNTLKAIHALQKKHIETTTPENVLKSATKVLLSLKIGINIDSLELKQPNLIEIFSHAQNEYESYLATKNVSIELYAYISQFKVDRDISELDIAKITKIITITKDRARQQFYTNDASERNPLKFELFQRVYKILLSTRSISLDSKKPNETETNLEDLYAVLAKHHHQNRLNKNDDIILVDTTTTTPTSDSSIKNEVPSSSVAYDADQDIGVGSVEPVALNTEMKEDERSKNTSTEVPLELSSNIDDTSNNSVLNDFMQSILKAAVPPKPKFEAQLLLEKIRANGIYDDQPQNFNLLTCHAQPFLQRISINGEFF